ncbi:MAG: vWA domain-containing protein [Pirellulaceae bacterium]|nr:vWA domain-containing protein [Pirellulaceae bacterium]
MSFIDLNSPLFAQASAGTYYQLARIQSLTEWWHWLLLLVVCAGIAAYVVWMYLKDSVELPAGLAVLLLGLRLIAFFGILFYFFNLEKRAERKLVKNSRAVILVDTSQSMGLRDTDATNVPAPTSRIEFVQQELASGSLVAKLREKHDVVIARFDEGENPVELASYPRKITQDEAAGQQLSEQDRLNQLVAQSRYVAMAGGLLLVVAAIAGFAYLVMGSRPTSGEQTSWTLLASITSLIAALIVLAVATLRAPEISPLAVLGLTQPKPAETTESSTEKRPAEQAAPIDWASVLAPRGAQTRIGDNLKFTIDRERGGPIAGVVLFTDGGNTAGIETSLAAVAAQDALIPVYTVGLGSDKRPANLRIVDLEAPERVYPGDKFTLTGYVQAQGTSRSNVEVELFSGDADGKNEVREDTRTVDVGKSGQVLPVKFELENAEQGIRQFKLRVKPLENEIDRRDNEKTAKVEIIDRKTKVLLIAGGPMRDFLFLRNQLYRDKEVTLDVWLQSGKPGISQEANEILHKFPETADELFEYDAIVAFDADWEALDELQVKLLDRWVADKAGGLIVVAGPVFTPQWSSRRRGDPRIDTLKALYPVAFYFQGSATLGLGRFGSEQAWPIQFTRDGLEAEFLWLDDDAIRSEQAWQQFKGVSGYYAVKDQKAGAKVYARFGDPDTAIDGVQPIYMAGQFYGSGRVFFIASGEMWRVNEVDDTYSQQFYTKLIRWAAEGRLLRDSSRGVLLVDKDRCTLGEQISVRAILQDSQFQPLSLEQVQAVLVQPDTTRQTLTMKRVRDEARDGTYVEQFTALQEGDYRIELQHPTAGDQLLIREVRAKIPAAETESPERNDLVLREIADKTGGDYFVGIEAAIGTDGTGRAALVNLLKPQDQLTILPGTPDRKFEQLLYGWLIGLICGVLCLEWLLRRLSKLA